MLLLKNATLVRINLEKIRDNSRVATGGPKMKVGEQGAMRRQSGEGRSIDTFESAIWTHHDSQKDPSRRLRPQGCCSEVAHCPNFPNQTPLNPPAMADL
jgi:hypothetical protein